LKAVRHWLTLGVVACAAAFAGQPPSPSPPAPPPPDAARTATPVVDPPAVGAPGADAPGVDAPGVDAPDDEFIEFLGADDVGDAAWWAFLKKSALRKDSTSKTPPQDAKQ
jgi:hypothetical protein